MLEESIQSKRHEIWMRLYGLLDLNPGGPSPGGRGRVAMMIRPVVSVDGILALPNIMVVDADMVVGDVVFHTVPEDESWEVYAYQAELFGGDRDTNQIGFTEGGPAGGSAMGIDTYTATNKQLSILPQPLPLAASWKVFLTGVGGTTDGAWRLSLLVRVSPSVLT